MSGNGLARLRKLLAERYDILKAQVANQLGTSAHMAGDALHDAYVRLAVRDDLDEVRYPQTYLVNTAVHAAIDRIRSDSRRASDVDIDSLFDLADESADPARTALARSEMEQMFQALEELTPRQRALLVEARVHETPRAELAKRWGVSQTVIGRDIQAAHRHCLRAMEKPRNGKSGK